MVGASIKNKGKTMFRKSSDKQFRATVAISSTMGGLWLLGIVALALVA